VTITGSKSESNRLLLLKALFGSLEVQNISNSDDSQYMLNALSTESGIVDIHHAGTAMRFLTAYFATLKGRTTLLTGSQRMKERPIKVLVDALRELGADIEYVSQKGYPPLRIVGKRLLKKEVQMKANVSSQYISALLLIASKLENGLTLHLDGKITSAPYIRMTLSLLNQIGVETSFEAQTIRVKPNQNPIVEDKAQLENLLENQKDITELYQELSYEELTDVLNTWLNPDDTSTESGTQTEVSSVVAETAKVEDASAAFDELFNK